MDAEEFLRWYATGERDFRGIILQCVDFKGIALDSVNLSGAIFYNVNLSGVRLSYVNLSSTEWWGCEMPATFAFCNLRNANIESCSFNYGFFYECDLREANMTNVFCVFMEYTRVNLQGSKRFISVEDYCLFYDVIREDGAFVPGCTTNLYFSEWEANRDDGAF